MCQKQSFRSNNNNGVLAFVLQNQCFRNCDSRDFSKENNNSIVNNLDM